MDITEKQINDVEKFMRNYLLQIISIEKTDSAAMKEHFGELYMNNTDLFRYESGDRDTITKIKNHISNKIKKHGKKRALYRPGNLIPKTKQKNQMPESDETEKKVCQ